MRHQGTTKSHTDSYNNKFTSLSEESGHRLQWRLRSPLHYVVLVTLHRPSVYRWGWILYIPKCANVKISLLKAMQER